MCNKDTIREAAEEIHNDVYSSYRAANIRKVERIIRSEVKRERERCIDEIEAIRDCYNTKKIDDALARIQQVDES